MPSEEMLRKLLDEFVEKQVLIDEEMKAVADQVQQLERRLIGCRDRLSTIGADRQRVMTMQHKWLEDSMTSTGQQYYPPAPTPASVVNTPAPPPVISTPEPTVQLAPKLSTPPPPAPVSTTPPVVEPEPPVLPTPPVVEPEPLVLPAEPVALVEPPAPVEPVAAVQTKSPSLNDFLSDPIEDDQPSPFNYPTEPSGGANLNNIFDDDATMPVIEPQINKGPSSTFASILSSRTIGNQTAPPPQPSEPLTTTSTDAVQEVEQPSGFGVLDRFTEDNQTQDNGGAQYAASGTQDNGGAQPAAIDKDGNAIVDLGAAEEADEDNDTVKSINDALRSLFR